MDQMVHDVHTVLSEKTDIIQLIKLYYKVQLTKSGVSRLLLKGRDGPNCSSERMNEF